jgi:hypothetical protein
MAKKKSSSRRRSRRSGRILLGAKRTAAGPRLPPGARSMTVHVEFGRDKERPAGSQIVACAHVGKAHKCVAASSPSKAIRRALSAAAGAGRSSALAGLSGGRHRRRRRRSRR